MGTADRRRREKESRRAAIVDIAEQVFLEKGLDGATMEDIAARSELSKGALYLHFRGKDELYLACAQREAARCYDGAFAAAAAARNGFEQVASMLRALVEHARASAERFRLAMSWLVAHSPIDPGTEAFAAHRAFVGQAVDRATAAFLRGQRDGTLRRDVPAERLVLWTWASLIGVLLAEANQEGLRHRLPSGPAASGLAELHIALVLEALRPASGRRYVPLRPESPRRKAAGASPRRRARR
jgi:AcrR family transcriptional regulator